MDTILFDLDGTLLPMDQDKFIKVYFGELTKKCAGHGFAPEAVTAAVWDGTKTMVKNDGSATNEDVFWDCFARHMGPEALEMKPVLERFYSEEFDRAQSATQPNPLAVELIEILRGKGYKLVLASNPVFPACAYRTRLAWIGLPLEDFDHFTSYETSHYCKPNPLYYREILREIGKSPEDCLMVGNDVAEDGCAKTLGMDFHLVTDNLINNKGEDLSAHKKTSFQEFFQLAKTTF